MISVNRKHHMTLLEVLIALALLAILLTSLMGIYQQMNTIERKISISRQENFRYLYLQYRLGQVLPNVVEDEAIGKEIDFAFYTSSSGPIQPNTESLVFIYDNGIDGNPLFSNHVIGKLFLDTKGRFCLATWPSFKEYSDINPPMRLEVLMEDIHELSFAFYRAPKKEEDENKSQSTGVDKRYGDWEKMFWSSEDEELPAIVRIGLVPKTENEGKQIQKNIKPVIFPFLIAPTKNRIIYQS